MIADPPSASDEPSTFEPTAEAALERIVADLQGRKQAWAELSIERRIDYLDRAIDGVVRVAPGQVQAAVRAEGLDPDSHAAGEEWIGGPYVTLRTLRLLRRTLESLRDHGRVPIAPGDVRVDDGRVKVRVFPVSALDRLLYSGFTADVWMQPEVTAESLQQQTAAFYRHQSPEGRVALVLGAGNVASIGPLDAIQKLFAEGQVVVLKLNPVNEYLGPFIEDAFSALVEDGFLRLAYGGAEVGDHLCRHPGVDEIHITGSAATHDAIVFGGGEEGAARKAENRPRIDKRITSELGNVSPMILVPGDWSAADLRFHAENVATQMTQNGGFNCNATKVLVTWAGWSLRGPFLDELRRVLRELPPRPAYYPGAEERYDRFAGAYPQTETLGERTEGSLPPALIPGVDPDGEDELAFSDESFCPITAETALPGGTPADFLRRAVDFCNESLHGTLNAGLIVDPRTERRLASEIDGALERLRYGSIALNHWPALSYGFGSTPWGAYPGHTLDDIQSGIGWVHNALLFDRPEKSVIRGPFRVFPKPVWFVTHETAHRVARRLVRLEADQSWTRLPGIVLQALRG